jgi:hypothetical protein
MAVLSACIAKLYRCPGINDPALSIGEILH